MSRLIAVKGTVVTLTCSEILAFRLGALRWLGDTPVDGVGMAVTGHFDGPRGSGQTRMFWPFVSDEQHDPLCKYRGADKRQRP